MLSSEQYRDFDPSQDNYSPHEGAPSRTGDAVAKKATSKALGAIHAREGVSGLGEAKRNNARVRAAQISGRMAESLFRRYTDRALQQRGGLENFGEAERVISGSEPAARHIIANQVGNRMMGADLPADHPRGGLPRPRSPREA